MFEQSFITEELWEAAFWAGVGYLFNSDPNKPPTMALLFKQEQACKAIFAEWRSKLGPVDKFEELRISIAEGSIPKEPEGYSVLITSDPTNTVKRAAANGSIIDVNEAKSNRVKARRHRMEPAPSSTFLSDFKRDYQRVGSYFIAPAYVGPNGPTVFHELAVRKNELFLVQTENIKQGQIESVLLT